MDSIFFYGTLRHRPLLDLVLENAAHVSVAEARLPGHAVHWAANQSFPLIVQQAGGVAEGLLAEGLQPQDLARLDYYEGGFDYARLPVTVTTGQGRCDTTVFFPEPGRWPVGAAWSLADWQRDWGAISLCAAEEVMSYYGQIDAAEVARWFPQIRVRAASRVMAQAGGPPVSARQGFGLQDVVPVARRRPYAKFFRLEERDLRFRRFDGNLSEVVTWAGFVSGDAVTVLPYDPVRDRVLIIEQFRLGPLLRGDRTPWCLEPIAGRIDPGETPEATAHRESREEAGLTLRGLETVARYYPSPGGVSEYLHSYVGIADLPDDAAGLGGEAAENEDIRSIVLDFEALMDLLASGEAETGPLLLSAYWLAANRSRLRRSA